MRFSGDATAGFGARQWGIVVAGALFTMAGCTTIGLTVAVTLGPGRTQADLERDRAACMHAADAQLQPMANRLNLNALRTAAQIAADNATIQRAYDAAYAGCMSGKGNAVAAVATPPAVTAGATAPPGSDGNGGEHGPAGHPSTDPDSLAAMAHVGPVVDQLRRDCSGETIVVSAQDAALSPTATSRLVALTQPNGGFCPGQPGENEHLLVKVPGDGLSCWPPSRGPSRFCQPFHRGDRDVELHSLGACVYRYQWDGRRYVSVAADQCAFPAPPGLDTLANKIRGR